MESVSYILSLKKGFNSRNRVVTTLDFGCNTAARIQNIYSYIHYTAIAYRIFKKFNALDNLLLTRIIITLALSSEVQRFTMSANSKYI